MDQSTRGISAANALRLEDFPTYYIYTIQAGNFARLNHILRPHGISVVTWRVLAALFQSDGKNISYLASRLALDRSNLSRILDGLLKEGLIERHALPHDRRNRLIFLSKAGKKKVNDAFPEVYETVELTLNGFSAEEREQFMGFLRRMKENVFSAGLP